MRVKCSTPMLTMHIADHIPPHMQACITHKLPHNHDLQPCYYTCAIRFELCRESYFMLCCNQAMQRETESVQTAYQDYLQYRQEAATLQTLGAK